jgi:AAA15 family ATPase/GTPase
MIKNLSIKNYKLFKDIEIKNISQFTLIGGKNNVGKTSLMEAMFMLFDKGRPDITIRSYHARGITNFSFTPEYIFEPIFNSFDIDNSIEIQANFKNIQRSLNIEKITKSNISISIEDNKLNQNTNISQQANSNIMLQALSLIFKDNDKITEQSILSLYPEIGLKIVETKPNDNFRVSVINARTISPQNTNSENVGNLIKDKKLDILLHILQIIAPEIKNIQSISIPNNNSILHVDIGKSKLIPLAFMGDGVNILVNIIATMYLCKNGILFLDEIENGLHYSVIKDIWKGIIQAGKKFECQLIATTHSDEFLRLANEAMQEENLQKQDFSYLKLERQGDEVRIGEFDYELFDYAIENMEIR